MASLLLKLYIWLDPKYTNIDRRKCHRTVPMKVLVLGCSRTATTSIRQALKDIGYNETYHAGCVYLENPRDAEMWVDAYKAKLRGEGTPFGRAEFDKLLGHCMAVTDVPCLHFMEELADAYPDAKIVLSVRDSPEAWLKSVRSTLIPFAKKSYGSDLRSRLYNLFLPRMPFQDMNDQMASTTTLEQFEKTTASMYTEHNDNVRALAARRDAAARAEGRPAPGILEFNVKQGWAPLCEFLGVPTPRDTWGAAPPFPRLNDTATFTSEVDRLGRVQNALVAVNVALAAGGAYVVWRVVWMVLAAWAAGGAAAGHGGYAGSVPRHGQML